MYNIQWTQLYFRHALGDGDTWIDMTQHKTAATEATRDRLELVSCDSLSISFSCIITLPAAYNNQVEE